ncbi:methyl-accepting chemotaxis protein [Ferrovibrio sp.]|uniref:methyl-accepting chemotaxis protein n=1 Tax=Ferrovibrio sp. TaxID=1917215 RepID=UPI0025C3094A|nr:methyl-accepting chemotaxis protein [Ferrovibrio sp.]MBX3454462.1 HAMP domain-containing protein [Ferrovibrio sp.]
MLNLSRINIGPRVFSVLILLSLVAAGVGYTGINALDRYEAQTNRMEVLSQTGNLLERVDKLVYAVVMDSRGIYMSRDFDEAKRFGNPLLENLKRLQKAANDIGPMVDAPDRQRYEDFLKTVGDFVSFRTELVRLGTEVSPAQGREYGDNDANRRNRQTLNQQLEVAAQRNFEQVSTLNHELTQFYEVQRPAMIMGMVAGVLVALLLGIYVVVATITRPIGRITGVMGRLAAGELTTQVDGAERGDEIGAMAKAVQVFKDSMIARERAEAEIAAQRQEAERKRAETEARDRQAAQEIATLCGKIAEGDFTERLSQQGKEGFYLAVSQQLNSLTDTLEGMAGELANVMGAMAQGDLTHAVRGQYQGVFGTLKDSANSMAERLRDFAGRLSHTAETVRGASGEISTGSQDLAQRTESQAASIEQTAASMHEITTTVRQNADNAQAANQLAGAARDTAEKGGNVTQQAVAAVSRIEDSARKISDIVALIDEIAFQTNLLALNASVEAARAGEAGKGFAVVAQEVRALAQRSANASKEIKSLITESNAQVKDGAALVNQTGASLSEIVAAVKKVSDIVAEIAAASREQATGLDQINTAVSSMDEMTQRNAALVEETTAAAQSLASQATELAQLVGFFRLKG